MPTPTPSRVPSRPGTSPAPSGAASPGAIAALVVMAGLVALVVTYLAGRGPGPVIEAAFDIRAFEAGVEQRVAPVTLRPAPAIRVRASDVEWRDPAGRAFLRSPGVVFSLRASAALNGDVVIEDGRVRRPHLELVRGVDGRWNYEPVLEPFLEGDPAHPERATRFALRNVTLADGTVTVRTPDAVYHARSLDARLASAEISGPGVPEPRFEFSRIEAVLDLPDTADHQRVTRRMALDGARFRLPDAALAFDIERGSFGASTFADALGVWRPGLGALGLDARLTVLALHLADLPWLRADVPEDAVAGFRARIEPVGPDRTALALSDLSLRATGSLATGSLRVTLGPGVPVLDAIDLTLDPLDLALIEAFTGPLPYLGELRGRVTGAAADIRFDLEARLATGPLAEPFLTDVTGRLVFTETGLRIRTVTARLDRVPLTALEPLVAGLPLRGPVSGVVTLSGPPNEAPFLLDVRLEAGGGIITVAGTLDVTGPVPVYDFRGNLIGVEPRQLLRPDFPPVRLHAAFHLAGSGTDPAEARARLTADGSFTGWRTAPGDTLALGLALDRGSLRAERGRVAMGPVALDATGEWRFANGTGGAIRYALVVASLEPLVPFFPPDRAARRRLARGALQATGTLGGTLDAPVLAGRLEARDFRYGEWAAARFRGDYDVRLNQVPVVDVALEGAEIRTPAADFRTAALTARMVRPTFDLAFHGVQTDGGIAEIEASGFIDDAGFRDIMVERVELDIERERWSLAGPARVVWSDDDVVRIENLHLVREDEDGMVRIDGVLMPFDQTALDLEVRRLPLGSVLDLTGIGLDAEGSLSLDGTLRGPADAPTLDLLAALEDGAIRGVAVRAAEARIEYANGVFLVAGTGVVDDTARVELEGRIPARLELGLPPVIALLDDGAIQGRVVTEGFPLAVLDPGILAIRDMEGDLIADMRLSGTVAAPVLDGSVRLANGAVTVHDLDQRYTDVQGVAVLEGRQIRIEELTARSGGTATARGTLSFDDLLDPGLELGIEFDGFRPQGVRAARDAGAWGTLRIDGRLRAPRLTGALRLDDGTVNVAALQGPDFDDQLIGVGGPFRLGGTLGPEMPEPRDPALVIEDLRIQAGGDLWFSTEEARVQLAGSLVVNRVGDGLAILGTLSGDRGTFQLRAGPVTRRFQIVDANVQFFGTPDPNPAIDITASRLVRTVDRGDVDVLARVTGTLDNPTLSLTAAGVAIPEAEVLSFLLFGRPAATLGDVGGQAGLLQEALAFYGILDLATAELAEAANLPVDLFQIQMRAGTRFGRNNLFMVIGQEIIDDVFLTFETPLDRSEIWSLSMDWRIDRQWRLEARFEPVDYLAETGVTMPIDLGFEQRQFFIAIRRRWTY